MLESILARRRRDGGTVLSPALISWHLESSSIFLQASRTRARLRANLHSNLLAVYSQQKFLPLRGADQMAPCGAGNFSGGEARAGKVAGKVCARRIDAARRAGLENQGAVCQRCRQHKRTTGTYERAVAAGSAPPLPGYLLRLVELCAAPAPLRRSRTPCAAPNPLRRAAPNPCGSSQPRP